MWLAVLSMGGALSCATWHITLALGIGGYSSWGKGLDLWRGAYALWAALFFTGISKALSAKRKQLEAATVRERIAAFDKLAELERDQEIVPGDTVSVQTNAKLPAG